MAVIPEPEDVFIFSLGTLRICTEPKTVTLAIQRTQISKPSRLVRAVLSRGYLHQLVLFRDGRKPACLPSEAIETHFTNGALW